jgi:hypothetical protein
MQALSLARHLGLVVLLGVSLLALPGCGSRGPKIVKIYGTVTHGGQPIKDLTIHFVPQQGRPSWGFTDPEGRYTLHYNPQIDGAVTGKHRVYVKYEPHDPEIQYAVFQGRFQFPPEIKAILDKYGTPEVSPLEFDLQKSQELDLKLD